MQPSAHFQIRSRWLLFCAVLLVTCAQKKDLPGRADLSLDLGFSIHWSHSGVVHDHRSRQEYLYFADLNSHFGLKVFDLKGRMVIEMPLVQIAERMGSLGGIAMQGLDSVIVCDRSRTLFTLLDGRGRIVAEKDHSGLLRDHHDRPLELNSVGNFISGGNIILACANEGAPVFDLATAKEAYQHYDDTPKLLVIEDPWNEPAVTFGVEGFFAQRYDHVGLWGELPRNYACSKTRVYYFSWLSDRVDVLDQELRTIQQFTVHSLYTPVHFVVPPLDSLEWARVDWQVNLRYQTKGQVYRLVPDEAKDRMLLAIQHEVPMDTPRAERGGGRQWSLLIMDKEYLVEKEVVFSGREHAVGAVYPTGKGIFILLKAEEGDRKARFDLVKY